MAKNALHPYTSSTGQLIQVIEYLKESFPTTFDAKTLQKLGLAAKNESYILNTLRFLGIIDETGKRIEDAHAVFTLNDHEQFKKGFSGLVKKAYKDLFDLRSDAAWTLDENALITYFRSGDKTSKVVGQRQARTFRALSSLAGHIEIEESKSVERKSKQPKEDKKVEKVKTSKKIEAKSADHKPQGGDLIQKKDVGLTVRIEVNLPAQGDQDTYDRIFKSIRKYLIDIE